MIPSWLQSSLDAAEKVGGTVLDFERAKNSLNPSKQIEAIEDRKAESATRQSQPNAQTTNPLEENNSGNGMVSFLSQKWVKPVGFSLVGVLGLILAKRLVK